MPHNRNIASEGGHLAEDLSSPPGGLLLKRCSDSHSYILGAFSCTNTEHECAEAACECDIELVNQLSSLALGIVNHSFFGFISPVHFFPF